MIVTLRNEQYQQLMSGHTKKISRLLAADTNIDEHIMNISSYRLSFFQKLVFCQGLNFSLPQRISSREILATFEKAYWKLEPKLSSDDKELAAATLRSITLNYSERKGPAPGYVGYTCRHLHQRIKEHKGSAIGSHLKEQHDIAPNDIAQFFKILKKCQSKFDCLIFEMFFIKELKPSLNKQCDSIRAKLFV